MAFIRRFSSLPALEVLTQIEGVDVIDLAPPGTIQGVGVGVAALVGEFADMTYAVAFNTSSGAFTSNHRPVQINTSQDLLDSLGGFDETLGEFGGDCGNGFVELRSHKFSGLVVVPINLCSSKGVRVWRFLPTNKSATDATPIVPMTAATVLAGREFKASSNRVRLGAKVTFFADLPRTTGIDGAVTPAGLPAATQSFVSAGADFTASGVVIGDIVVIGVLSGAGALGTNANQYRVTSITNSTTLVLQRMDGSDFTTGNWVSGTNLPYRIHPARTADVGGQLVLSAAGSYLVPARPLDATVASATALVPTVVPDAATATSWDPLSGLAAMTDPTTGVVYDANVQAPNAVNHASIDALYSLALDSLLAEADPARRVNLVWTARKPNSSVNGIASALRQHVLTASASGRGRRAFISPALDVITLTAAKSTSAPGVQAYRNERVSYNWPGVQIFVPEAVGFSLLGADGVAYTDGKIDVAFDSFNAVLCSNLEPHRNPGQTAPPVDELMAPIIGMQRACPTLKMADYIDMKSNGIAAPRLDPDVGYMQLQSGITSSLTSGQTNQNRRAFADYIQDSVSSALVFLAKLPMTESWKDNVLAEVGGFLENLKSPNNPPAQKIEDYVLDIKGQTDTLKAAGVFLVRGTVKMLGIADKIVFQTQVGAGINLTTAQ